MVLAHPARLIAASAGCSAPAAAFRSSWCLARDFHVCCFRCRFATYLCLCQHKHFVHPELEQKKINVFFSSSHRVPDGCGYHLLWNSVKFSSCYDWMSSLESSLTLQKKYSIIDKYIFRLPVESLDYEFNVFTFHFFFISQDYIAIAVFHRGHKNYI